MPRTRLSVNPSDGTFFVAIPEPSEPVYTDAIYQIRAPITDEEVIVFGERIARSKAQSIIRHVLQQAMEKDGHSFNETLIQWSEERDSERMITFLIGTIVLL